MKMMYGALGVAAIGLALAFIILAVPQSSGDGEIFIIDKEAAEGHWYLAYDSSYSPNEGYSVRTVENYPDIGSGDLDIIKLDDTVLYGRHGGDYITGTYEMGRIRTCGDEWNDMSTGVFREDGTLVLSTTGSTDGIGWSSIKVFTKSVDRSAVSLPDYCDVTGKWTGDPTFCINGVFGSSHVIVEVDHQNGNLFDARLVIDGVDYITSGVVYNLCGDRMVGRISSGLDHSIEIEIVSGDIITSHVGTDLTTGLPFCASGLLSRNVATQPNTDNGLDHTTWRCTSSFRMDALGEKSNDILLYSIEFHANVNGVTIGTWIYGNESVPVSAQIDKWTGTTLVKMAWVRDGIETKCVGSVNDEGNTMTLYEFKTLDGIPVISKSVIMLSSHVSAPDIVGHWYLSHTAGYLNDSYQEWNVAKDVETEAYCDFDIYRTDGDTVYGMRNGTPFVGYYSEGIFSVIMTKGGSRDISMGWIENDGTLTTINTHISSSGDRHVSYSSFSKVRGDSSILNTDVDFIGTWYAEEPVRVDSDGSLTMLQGKTLKIAESIGGAFKGTMEQDLNGRVTTVPLHGYLVSTTWGYSRGVIIDDNYRTWGIDLRYGIMSVSCIGGYTSGMPSYSIQKNYVMIGDDDVVKSEVGIDEKTVWGSSEATVMRDDGISFVQKIDAAVHVEISYGNCYAGWMRYNGTDYAIAGYVTHIGDKKVTRLVANLSDDEYSFGFGVYHDYSIDLTLTYEKDGMQMIGHCILELVTGATS